MNALSILFISIALICIIATMRQLNKKMNALIDIYIELKKMMMANSSNDAKKAKLPPKPRSLPSDISKKATKLK